MKIPHDAAQLSLQAATTEAHTPYSLCSTASEATAMRNLHSAIREQPPLTATRESWKLVHSTEDSAAKNK